MVQGGCSQAGLQCLGTAATPECLRFQHVPCSRTGNRPAQVDYSAASPLILWLLCAKHAACVNSLWFGGLNVSITYAMMVMLLHQWARR